MTSDDPSSAGTPSRARPPGAAAPIVGDARSSRPNGRSLAPGAREPSRGAPAGALETATAVSSGPMLETTFSPFHCLYQDALHFHTQCRLAHSAAEAGRLARAALLLYISSAEALVHQAAEDLGRPELRGLIADPSRPIPLAEAWRLLPAIAAEPGTPIGPFDPEAAPWPQFNEILMLRTLWAYPGPAASRRAFYLPSGREGEYEPLQPHQLPPGARRPAPPEALAFPRTGLPRDPYALRPHHLDTARGILDDAVRSLDRRMGGALTRDNRHRREPTRLL